MLSSAPRNPLVLTPDELARAQRVEALLAQGPSAVAQLVSSLDDPSWSVRRQVVAALAALGEPAIAPLCELLRRGRDDENRLAAAVDALVANGADVYDAVLALASADNPAVVSEAAQIFGRRRTARAVPVLAFLVEHADDNVATAAIEALGRIGGRAVVPTLIGALQSRNFFRAFPVIDVLGRSGDPRAITPLAELLNDGTFRLEAARALGRSGEAAAVAPLAAQLSSPSELAARVAAVSLAELFARHAEKYGGTQAAEAALKAAQPGEPAARRLAQSLASADAQEKAAVAEVLGRLGGDIAVSTLRRLLDEGEEPARVAAQAFRRLGRASEAETRNALREANSARRALLLQVVTSTRTVPEIELCLEDPDPTVRALACDALARLGAAEAVAPVFERLADPNPRVVQAAIGAIQSLGSEQALTLAEHAAGDARDSVRRGALRILAYFGNPEAVPLFLRALADPDPRVRDTALAGLPYFDDPAAIAALLGAAREPASAKVRSGAVRGLGQVTRPDVRVEAALIAALGDADPWVRYYACQALGRLGVDRAVKLVARLLADPAGQVRVAAIEALSHLRDPVANDALRAAAESEAEPDMQRAALIGLGIARPPQSLPVLLRATRSADAATRLVALSALTADGAAAAEAIPALAQAARDRDENVRASALGFLAAAPGAEATAVLVDVLRERREPDATNAASALAVHTEGRVAALISALESADEDVAPRLTAAMARMRMPEATEGLLAVLRTHPAPARKAAAEALASIGSGEATAALRRAAQGDPDAQVRQVCAILLTQ